MQLNPYLTFNGNCEEAFNFYAKCLRGELALVQRFGDTPGCEGMPASHRDKIMHVRLQLGDQVLMASDNHPDHPFEGIKGCSIALSVDQADEADRIFNELAQGGVVAMPMQETFWAKRFGMVNDRFGVPWMINGAMQR
ncbi:MAG TPA: VOC family protein [Lysobacter sp.]|nr:VOC family protein [Lysobacter sp.]